MGKALPSHYGVFNTFNTHGSEKLEAAIVQDCACGKGSHACGSRVSLWQKFIAVNAK